MTTIGVVTGASRGMGRACVDRLRPLVDVLVAVDLTTPDIDGTVGVACDIADTDAVDALAATVAGLGSFRLLAHAAGLSPSMADAGRVLDVNLLGTIRILDALEPLVGAGSAAVCFSSSAGYLPMDLLGPEYVSLLEHTRDPDLADRAVALISDPGVMYAWTKKAVQLEAAAASTRWAARGGRVLSLSPGNIDTPMGQLELAHQPFMRQQVEQHPMQRLGTPGEVAAVAAFLLSDDASFLSGIDVLVDGGAMAADLARLRTD